MCVSMSEYLYVCLCVCVCGDTCERGGTFMCVHVCVEPEVDMEYLSPLFFTLFSEAGSLSLEPSMAL